MLSRTIRRVISELNAEIARDSLARAPVQDRPQLRDTSKGREHQRSASMVPAYRRNRGRPTA